MIHALKEPIVVGGKTITSVNVRSAKARDLQAIEHRNAEKPLEGGIDGTLWLIGLLTDITEAEAGELGVEDFKALSVEVTKCLGEGPAEAAKT